MLHGRSQKGSDFAAPKKPHNAIRNKTDLASMLKWPIHYFGVAHNTSYLPPKHFCMNIDFNLRKQPTFNDATTCFPAK